MQREFKVEGIQEINPRSLGGSCSRAMTLNRKEVNWNEGIETVASTDAPVLVVDWQRWEMIREVLPMKYFSPPDGDKVPLLDSHSRFSVENIIGSAKNFRATATDLLVNTIVSESEKAVRQKIEEGHIDSVSIGYHTYASHTVEIPRGQEVKIDGRAFRNDFEDNIPYVVRTKWDVKELSLVAIGANDAAKFRAIASEEDKKFFDKLADQQKAIEQLRSDILQLKEPKSVRDLKRELVMKLTIMKHELNINN